MIKKTMIVFSIVAILFASERGLNAQDPFEIEIGGIEGAFALPEVGGRFLSTARGGDSWISSTVNADGDKTIKGANPTDGQFEIVEGADGTIKVKLSREYGVDDAEEIMESHPELYMYLKAIPTEIGDSEITIKINIATTYEADSADELKEKSEEAFKIYEKFTGDGPNRVLESGGVIELGRLRPMRVFPRRGIEGGGFRLRLGPDGGIEIIDGDEEEAGEDDEVEDEEESDQSEKEKADF